MKKLVIGILAHVDAGKTTLAEAILYKTGKLRKAGRVDHKNTFLDTYELERQRGITIFSKQAVFTHKDMNVTLLDTPGHVDFSAEMERTLQVLDYAILVINGSDGVQGHTETLWRLLSRYKIPVFIFVNKMDLDGTDKKTLISNLKKHLNEGCTDFNTDFGSEAFCESIAVCDEHLLNKYLEHGEISKDDIAELIVKRKLYPCYFGSALWQEGIDDFLDGLAELTRVKKYPEKFGAKVFKISRDEQGNRLTYMKITGGKLRVKNLLTNKRDNISEDNKNESGKEKLQVSSVRNMITDENMSLWEEKVDQIRIYSGVKYDVADELEAGSVCTVTGLTKTFPGEGLGIEAGTGVPLIEPVLTYKLILPPECSPFVMYSKLLQLEEEDPQLHIGWNEQLKELHVQLMGEIQLEILQNIIFERFAVRVDFGPGNIVYKETIADAVVGVGHYEPLRHYAEVHLLMEPGESGSGLVFSSSCSEDLLERNWQRAVLTHLEEKEHIGVLIGAPITDMKITLIVGRAHLKHTEGGDFRQATYRAVRQGLKKAKSILLEPYYNFRLELPSDCVGRAMADIIRMNGSFNPPEIAAETAVLTGSAPVASMRGYQTEVIAYSKGRGKLFCIHGGYRPCHNAEEIILEYAYDSERDLDNPTSSVFCSHGAGFVVEWDKVDQFKHIDDIWQLSKQEEETDIDKIQAYTIESKSNSNNRKANDKGVMNYSLQEDKELEDIYVRTFGPIKDRRAFYQGGANNTKGKKAAEINAPSDINGADISAENTEKSIQQAEYNSQGKYTEQFSKNKGKHSKEREQVGEYLLVDGYNIIFAWDELNKLARSNMDAARYKLMDLLCNYQGYKNCTVILVYDAYKVKGGLGEVINYHNIYVVYTKEAETADSYIEKVTHEMAGRHHVTVASSDALEQLIIMGQGAVRLSANELKAEIKRIAEQIRNDHLNKQAGGRNYIREHFDESILDFLLNHKDEQK